MDRTSADMTDGESVAPKFNAWLDEFFGSYYRRRPVNATFIGHHEYDHLLPDLSPEGVSAARAEMQSLRQRLHRLPREQLSAGETFDHRMAGAFLEIAEWETRSDHFISGNPSVFTGEAVFSVISLLLSPFAPVEERCESAIRRLLAIPSFLGQARDVIRAAPPAWTARARQECIGARALLTSGIDLFTQQHGLGGNRLRLAADGAVTAFASFDRWLSTELPAAPATSYACGEEALDMLVRRGHFLSQTLEELERYALDQLEQADAYLREHAADFDAATPKDVLSQLADLHPLVDEYYPRYGRVWTAAHATARELDLLTWPEYPIAFQPQPEWVREAAPYLYFLFYRSPAPFDHPLPVTYLVTPIEPEMPPEQQVERLRACNNSVIKLNHVVHHAGIGHHVQNWHAFRSSSRIGQIAGVDCASRIALFCGGTMTEGWACYATELMDEMGFLTPRESYAERHTRLRMAARAVVDIRLHQGRWSLAEASTFYQERVWMAPSPALAEAVKNSLFPGTALMYLFGTDAIGKLRRDLARRDPDTFKLGRFHDRFLSYGSVPVALIAEAMRQEVKSA